MLKKIASFQESRICLKNEEHAIGQAVDLTISCSPLLLPSPRFKRMA